MGAKNMLFMILGYLMLGTHAQFGFFDQMFGGGGGGHHPQNVRSDSSWYQSQYENGTLLPISSLTFP
jgi:hypothetical protein